MRLASLLACACSIPLPAIAAAPVYQVAGNWLVACDNIANCEVRDLSENTDAQLQLHRAAGTNGAMQAQLFSTSPLAPNTLRVDGKPLALNESFWSHTQNPKEGNSLSTQDPAGIALLLTRLRNGQHLQWGTDEGHGLSLKGLDAALQLIDTVQGRLHTSTAWQTIGTRPVNQVHAATPPPPAPIPAHPPALDAATAKHLIAQVRATQTAVLNRAHCSVKAADASDSAYALSLREALVTIECLRGAYQSTALLFRTPRNAPNHARLLILPTLPPGRPPGESTIRLFSGKGFDPATSELSYFVKNRGLGDCGTRANWIWTGKDFMLTSYQRLDQCTGNVFGDWPTLWRTSAPR